MHIKERLRKKYFSIRKKKYFDIDLRFFNSLIKLLKKRYKKKSINLSFYYPSSYELNVLKILDIENINRMKTYLPVIQEKNSINFYRWSRNNVLRINKFGLLEPAEKKIYIIPNVMLVPLLEYDNKKNRLGYGKGFYDRYLAKYLKEYKNITTIGIAFSFQKHHKLPVSTTDIKLDYIMTERGIF